MSLQPDTSESAPQPGCHLDRVRYAELSSVRSLFPKGATVLEVGGGNGYQAAVLTSWGFQVISIDIDTQGAWTQRYFDVVGYDGKVIPVESGKVDVVFSSNVLEHIPQADLMLLFAEMRRVLAPGGFLIHILPSPVWRFWTMMAHYPWLIARLVRGSKTEAGIALPTLAATMSRRGWLGLVKRTFWPAPHGEYPSSVAELFAFRENAWRKRFEAGGFEVVRCCPTGIFYTGYTLLPRLPMSWRFCLARLLGSACKIYVVKQVSPCSA